MSEVSLKPFNPDTQKVMDVLEGKFTQKQIIQNFFGLRDQVIIAEDGKTVLEVFDDFKDPVILEEKGVEWKDQLGRL